MGRKLLTNVIKISGIIQKKFRFLSERWLIISFMEIKFFHRSIQQFIESLEQSTFAHVLQKIQLLEEFGHAVGMPHSKKIGKRLFELRIRGVQEVRLIYIFHDGLAFILHAFVKKTDRIPLKEIKLARKRQKIVDNL